MIAYHPKLFLLNAAAKQANRSASVNGSESSSDIPSLHSSNGSSGYFAFFKKQLLIALPTYSPLIQPESDMLSRRHFICSRKNGRYLSMIFGLSLRNTSKGISFLTARGIQTSWIISVNDFHCFGCVCCLPDAVSDSVGYCSDRFPDTVSLFRPVCLCGPVAASGGSDRKNRIY